MTTALDSTIGPLLADVARIAILPRYQHLTAGDVVAKAVDDMVTVADTHAEALLTEALANILPEAAIVGEEAAFADPKVLDRLGDSLCWIIDPLDGTNNFAAGRQPFGILIALAQSGETVAGWIYDVLSGRLCSAHRGAGAWINGEPVRARTSGQEPPIAAISLMFQDADRRSAMAAKVAPYYTVVDIPRCAAEQYPRIVTGINDVSIFERTLAWDHAAGVLFVNEAGGRAARTDGSPYRVDRHLEPGLIAAASPALFDAMAARLREL